jgi:hypothetical protein
MGDTNEMSSMDMSMQMTFLPFGQYRGVKVLFGFWEITSVSTLIFTCLILFGVSIFNVWLKHIFKTTDHNMASRIPLLSTQDETGFRVRLQTGLLAALQYTVSLLLMLAAMTFQPWIFLAIVTGHGYGSFIYFTNDSDC